MTDQRKATDVILELEQKLDVALGIIRINDMNLKIISNKLNTILELLEKKSVEVPKITVEAVQTTPSKQFPAQIQVEDQIPISSEVKLPIENEPLGFRRTSRPETFAGDDAYLTKPSGSVSPKYPVQIPQAPPGRGPNNPPPGREPEAVVQAPPKAKVEPPKSEPVKQAPVLLQNAIPVQQRVVNANGKSLFLADVEIVNLDNMQQVTKTRTNGMGKWMGSLGIGNYRVIIRKMDTVTQKRLELTQDIKIDGSVSPLELQTAIVKI